MADYPPPPNPYSQTPMAPYPYASQSAYPADPQGYPFAPPPYPYPAPPPGGYAPPAGYSPQSVYPPAGYSPPSAYPGGYPPSTGYSQYSYPDSSSSAAKTYSKKGGTQDPLKGLLKFAGKQMAKAEAGLNAILQQAGTQKAGAGLGAMHHVVANQAAKAEPAPAAGPLPARQSTQDPYQGQFRPTTGSTPRTAREDLPKGSNREQFHTPTGSLQVDDLSAPFRLVYELAHNQLARETKSLEDMFVKSGLVHVGGPAQQIYLLLNSVIRKAEEAIHEILKPEASSSNQSEEHVREVVKRVYKETEAAKANLLAVCKTGSLPTEPSASNSSASSLELRMGDLPESLSNLPRSLRLVYGIAHSVVVNTEVEVESLLGQTETPFKRAACELARSEISKAEENLQSIMRSEVTRTLEVSSEQAEQHFRAVAVHVSKEFVKFGNNIDAIVSEAASLISQQSDYSHAAEQQQLTDMRVRLAHNQIRRMENSQTVMGTIGASGTYVIKYGSSSGGGLGSIG